MLVATLLLIIRGRWGNEKFFPTISLSLGNGTLCKSSGEIIYLSIYLSIQFGYLCRYLRISLQPFSNLQVYAL
jgi:hypothetical protein